jgi:hypothetical protein
MENNKPAVTWNLQSNGRKEFEWRRMGRQSQSHCGELYRNKLLKYVYSAHLTSVLTFRQMVEVRLFTQLNN